MLWEYYRKTFKEILISQLSLLGRLIMPKSSKAKVEADEMKVLMELRKNSRQSLNELAEKCGFSRQKVWRIVNDLEKNQTIWGYSAVIDEEKLGQKQFFILIKKLATKPPDRQAEIALDKARREKLEKAEIFIEGSYYTHGSHDWILIVNAKNIIEITKLVESIRKDYHDFISEIQIIEIMFPVVKEGKENPKKTNLKEFF